MVTIAGGILLAMAVIFIGLPVCFYLLWGVGYVLIKLPRALADGLDHLWDTLFPPRPKRQTPQAAMPVDQPIQEKPIPFAKVLEVRTNSAIPRERQA
jgi:hypothetical protein